MNEPTEAPDSVRIWPILWRGKWTILASIVVMAVAAILYTLHQTKEYQASGIIQVNLPTGQPGSQDTTAANQGLAANYAQLLTSPGFLNDVRARIEGGKLSTDSLQSRLSATALPMTALVELKATGTTPQGAQVLATQVIDGFLSNLQTAAANRTAQEQRTLQQAIDNLDAQIVALAAQPSTAATTAQIGSLRASRGALIAENANLAAAGVADQTSATVSAPPVASSSPVAPQPFLNLIAGLVLGALLGVGLAYLQSALRSEVQSAEEAAALTNVPVLASIPLRRPLFEDDASVQEAYGVLHTNLLFSLQRSEGTVVGIVSYNPQAGKSSVVQGLSEASVRSHGDMLIVDGDMRAATLSKRLGYAGYPGMADVLQGGVSFERALVELRPGLWLLPARESQVNPQTLLSSERMKTLSGEWRKRFDLVLVDTPAIAGLADGLILSAHADLLTLVVRTGLTRPSEVRSAMASLSQTHTPIAGVVVFEEPAVEARYPYVSERERKARWWDLAGVR
jgi:succinoglycan biosynthesis transport protein ExoP